MKSLVILHFKINMLVLVFGVKEKTDLIQSETETRTSKMFFGDFWATVRGNLATIEFTQVILISQQVWGCPLQSEAYEFTCLEYDPWDSRHIGLKEWDPSHKKYQVPIGDFCSSKSIWPVSCLDFESGMEFYRCE